jgi:hypothetical protein
LRGSYKGEWADGNKNGEGSYYSEKSVCWYVQPQAPIYTTPSLYIYNPKPLCIRNAPYFPAAARAALYIRHVTCQQVRRHVQERRLRVRRVAVQRCLCPPRLLHAPPARVPLTRLLLTPPPDGGYYSGAFARGQPAAGPGVFTFANGNKQSGKWIEQARRPPHRALHCKCCSVTLCCII